MCRSEVPADYLDSPLLLDTEQLQREMARDVGYQWFYEGRNGPSAALYSLSTALDMLTVKS